MSSELLVATGADNINGRVFEDCDIYGPSMLLLDGAVRFRGNRFYGPTEGMFFVLEPRRFYTGMILAKDTTFINTSYEAAAHIDANGKLVLQEPAGFKRAMNQFGRGLAVTVRVDERRDKRSQRANRYYWLIIGLISDHTGYEKDELHELFKKRFNPVTLSLGNEADTIGGSTRKMDTKVFGEYVERIRRFAETELGVVTPDPESQAA